MNFNNHPCFNEKASHLFGRVHLSVAPKCNIQCRYCNRKYDCVNESRPGVTSAVLKPYQAIVYLKEVLRQKPYIMVVGIAGPGDCFANSDQTINTCRYIRESYPDMIICLATNWLNIQPYLDELVKLKVSHVTVTVNAIDQYIGAKIYSWIRINNSIIHSKEASEILIHRQLKAIKGLKKRNITVKVNSIILPGINENHIIEVAEKAQALGVDIFNCVPYYKTRGCEFEHIAEPTAKMVKSIRKKAEKFIKQMYHCTRCRADAVGMLGERLSSSLMNKLKKLSTYPNNYN